MNISKFVRGGLATLMVSATLLGAGYVSEASGITNFTQATEVQALGGAGNFDSNSESMERLKDKVYSEVADNTYRTNTGDGISGSKVYNQKGEVTSTFDKLTEGDKNKVIQDINRAVKKAADKDAAAIESGDTVQNAVTEGTVNRFWKDMKEVRSSTAGYLISVVTADVAPDWAGASNFLSPFYPFFNTAIAVFLILASFSFFFHLAVAIFYFMTPSFQYFVKGSEGTKGGFHGYVASIIPKQAVLANDQAMDKGGNPLLIYIGKTWIMMLAYALILVFFATNSMLVLVGPISSLFTSLVGL